MTEKSPKKKPSFFTQLRFRTALFATAILNLNIFGFSLKSLCSPGFNCHGCPWATAACPIGVFAYSSAIQRLPLYALSFILAIGLILGRLVCGFACPFGFFQDLLYKIPFLKIKLPRFLRYLKYACLVLLVFLLPFLLGMDISGYLKVNKPAINKDGMEDVTVDVTLENISEKPVKGVAIDLVYMAHDTKKETFRETKEFPDVEVKPGEKASLPTITVPNKLSSADLLVSSPQSSVSQTPKFQLYICRVCPNGILTASLPAKLFAAKTSSIYTESAFSYARYAILAVFLLLMLMTSRPFCRMMCPLGATYALTSKASVMSLQVDNEKCINCGQCDTVCPVDLDVRNEVGGMECIACGDCMKACPVNCITRINTLTQKKPAASTVQA